MVIKLAENIKSLRESRMITQSELAEALYVTPQSVSRWETGTTLPDIEKLPDIAMFFGVTTDELIGTSTNRLVNLADKASELRLLHKKDSSDETLAKLCDVLEKLINEDGEFFVGEYFSYKRQLCEKGAIDGKQMDKARALCRKALNSLKGDRLINKLATILANEDEEHKEEWSEFVPSDNQLACWNDMLLLSSIASHSTKAEQYRQEVMLADLTKFIYLLTQSHTDFIQTDADYDFMYRNCQKALKVIDIFSKNVADIFLPARVHVEFALAKACFGCGKNDEGFGLLDNVRKHMKILYDCLGTKQVQGAEDSFELCRPEIDENAFSRELCMMYSGDKCFENVKTDIRITEFFDYINSIESPVVNEECVSDDFRMLYGIAVDTIDSQHIDGDYAQVIVLLSSKGNVYKQIIQNAISEDESDEENIITTLKKARDTRIVKLVAVWQNRGIDHPSYRLKRKLCDLNRENINAEMLVQGFKSPFAFTIGRSLGKYDLLRYKNE